MCTCLCLKKCIDFIDIVLGIVIPFFVLIDVILYLAFYYLMAVAVQPYTSSAFFLSAFSNLFPAIFTLMAGLLGRYMITVLKYTDGDVIMNENIDGKISPGKNEELAPLKKIDHSRTEYGATNMNEQYTETKL